jgi:hypothetical protein
MRHEIFRVGPQLLQRCSGGCLLAPDLKHVGEPNAPMGTDAAERQITYIHSTSNQWP